MFSGNNRIKNKNQVIKLANLVTPNTLPNLYKAKSDRQTSILTKSMISELQSELRNAHGYQISLNSLPNLLCYYQYHMLLKETISEKNQQKKQKNRFMNEFSLLHSEEYVSRLFNQFKNKDKQMKNSSKIYKQQCLYDYFQLRQFTSQKLVSFLINKINQAKIEGSISYEDIRKTKNGNTIAYLDCKQNKITDLRIYESKRVSKLTYSQQSKTYYSILALKILMKQLLPNMVEINKICEQIKANFEQILSSIKIKSSQIPTMKCNNILRNASISK